MTPQVKSGRLDALVLGGNVDGLVCAALLAKGGLRVALCEPRGVLGGISAGEEIAPGIRTAGDGLAWSTPAGLLDRLELERHGLALRHDRVPVLVPSPGDGDGGLLVHFDAARMSSALGGLGAARYAAFRDRIERWTQPARAILFDVPPDLALLSARVPLLRRAGERIDLARKGLGLRHLGSRDMTELLRAAPMAIFDLLDDELGPDRSGDVARVKAALAATAIAGTTLGPRAPGTAASFLLDAFGAGAEPVGGPPALVDALVRCARSHGVTLRTSTRVRRITVANGRATGALVANAAGEERFEAALVVSAHDIATTALALLDPADVPDALERAGRVFKRRGRAAVVHLALERAPEFACLAPSDVERAISTSSLDAMERASDDAKHGRLAADPWAELRVVRSDASRAGDGCAVTLHVHACPEHADDDATREAVDSAARAALERLAPGAAIRASTVKLPVDLAREHGLAGGHLAGGELILDQLWVQRPASCAARYATPLAGLWLAGPSSHPGGGLPGGAGVLAARAILAASSYA